MADNDQAGEIKFAVRRLYLKDSSYEAPNAPECFLKDFKPQIDLNMNLRNKVIDKEKFIYEVVLKLTVKAEQDNETLFIVELEQAGLFEIVGDYDEDNLRAILNISCPNILFPYAREAIDSLTIKGSYPALMLSPIGFESVYAQAEAKRKEDEAAAASK